MDGIKTDFKHWLQQQQEARNRTPHLFKDYKFDPTKNLFMIKNSVITPAYTSMVAYLTEKLKYKFKRWTKAIQVKRGANDTPYAIEMNNIEDVATKKKNRKDKQ